MKSIAVAALLVVLLCTAAPTALAVVDLCSDCPPTAQAVFELRVDEIVGGCTLPQGSVLPTLA